ncbi:phospholipase A2 group XV isoform X7 [Lagenorhynchus albirostris]|uniref:phospholipase A2 group XV isoform X7 n=1 Tax=Lagenorhynchus albirostris TaxID=27610 RepID=UPI0028E96F84|nr:phospholipase A2 group XV isoform X7 [Lagenorhynchus albirostris]
MTTLRCPCPTPLLASVHESRMNESEIRYAGGISEAPTANRTLGTWEKGTWSIEPARKLAESHPHFSPWKPATKAAGAPAAVPGDLGNQLEAKLDKPTVVHYLCSKRTDSYFTLWLNLELLLPVIIDCWIDNIRPENGKGMWLRTQGSIGTHQLRCHLWVTGSISPPGRLVYNRTSRTTQFPDGVDVRVPGFGKTFSLEFLDPSKSSVGSYFHTMVESLVGWGYTRGEDVRGAPYDWRRAPTAATGLEGQVYPCLCGTGSALGGRGQDPARPGLRRQQPDPGHWAPEDPGAAAVCCLHQLAAALQLYLVTQKGLRAHTHSQLHAAGLSPLLPGHRLRRRLAYAAGHGGAG